MRQRTKRSTTFAPWRADRVRSGILALLVAPLSAVGLYLAGAPLAIAALFALGVIAWSTSYWRRASVRAFGKRFEGRAVWRASHALQQAGFQVEAGRMVSIGDVDLIVRSGGALATVEIKSFGYWRSRFRDMARQQRARRQARMQRQLIGARHAVIWLPNARTTWLSRLLGALFPERNPYVVVGNTDDLVRLIRDLRD